LQLYGLDEETLDELVAEADELYAEDPDVQFDQPRGTSCGTRRNS
jgi:hypothetical protein